MSKRRFDIKTPRGVISKVSTKGGDITAELKWNPGFGGEMNGALLSAQEFIDSEVLRFNAKYIPFDTGMLMESGKLGTEIGSGEVKYIAPYSAKQYYQGGQPGSNDKGPSRGRLWFERMKADHLDEILNGAAKKVGRKL